MTAKKIRRFDFINFENFKHLFQDCAPVKCQQSFVTSTKMHADEDRSNISDEGVSQDYRNISTKMVQLQITCHSRQTRN